MTQLPFVHLRVHTAYSLSEGAVRLGGLIKRCKEDGMPAVAVTDSNNLFGALEFSKAAAGSGVQPILGAVLKLCPYAAEPVTGIAAKGSSQIKPDILALYVQNELGYRHLMDLLSESFLDPVEQPGPILDYSRLEGRTDGLIALTGGVDGAIGRLLGEGRKNKAHEAAQQLMKLFPGRLYVELQRHGREIEREVEPELIELAAEHKLPLVATNDVYFLERKLYASHDTLLCIAEGRYVLEEDRRRLTQEHYFKSQHEMRELFADLPEALANTAHIARRCAFMSPARDPILPSFVDGDKENEDAEFVRVAREGLEWRLESFVFTPEMKDAEKEATANPYRERLEFELSVICKMQFAGYFLIVSDFIRWAKEHGIPVGPGRGSGAGSVVAWAMRITDLDPLRFSLLFERFLNPERVSMPDFDVDFCQDRRDEVIRYVQQKYGRDRVAQIITFGKLQARAVLRDVGRVLQMPYPQVDRICKLVPNNPANPVTLQEAIDMEPLLRQAIKDDAQVQEMTGKALELEGLYRHASTHAAGVVIADRPLKELVPLYRDPKSDMPVVQFSMKYAEMAGLVKFDFLGLKTLTVLDRACRMVQETTGKKIDLLQLPFDDKPTYELLGRGEAIGVFQLESAGMRDTLRKLKPDTFEDIIALVSLYRPGPMDNIPTYIARKHKKEIPEYPHAMIESILKETFGVIIYQEQVMQIAQVMGGYSLGQADLLRRAMGKKIKEEMDKQRDVFVAGAIKNGVNKAKAQEVFELMAKFAGYGFNKSHGAAYALIAYHTAYLKANYPAQFFCALMELDAGNTDKLDLFRQDAERLGIKVLPPDINRSTANFSVEMQQESGALAIRYALGALRNVGMGAMQAVTAERDAHGPFKDVFDFARRIDNKVMNRRGLEFLVKAGVFDSLEQNRRQLFEGLDILVAYNSQHAVKEDDSQASLFGESIIASIPMPRLPDVQDWPTNERLSEEFSAIGFYLSAHPLEDYMPLLKKQGVTRASDLIPRLGPSYSEVRVAGVVLGCKVKVSPKGKFAFLTLSDPSGVYEVSVFNEMLLNTQWEMLQEGNMVLVNADGKKDDSGPRLIAQAIKPLDQAMKQSGVRMTWPSIVLQLETNAELESLKQLLQTSSDANAEGTASAAKGQSGTVRLKIPSQNGEVLIRLQGGYRLTAAELGRLGAVPGVILEKQAA